MAVDFYAAISVAMMIREAAGMGENSTQTSCAFAQEALTQLFVNKLRYLTAPDQSQDPVLFTYGANLLELEFLKLLVASPEGDFSHT